MTAIKAEVEEYEHDICASAASSYPTKSHILKSKSKKKRHKQNRIRI